MNINGTQFLQTERTIVCLHILKADQFYYPHGVRRGGYLELVDGKFGKHVESLPEGADVLDYSGYSIAPGLVDTHIHGIWWGRCDG